MRKFSNLKQQRIAIASTALSVLVIGLVVYAIDSPLFSLSRAAGVYSYEAEDAVLAGVVGVGTDSSASGGSYIEFSPSVSEPASSPTGAPKPTISPSASFQPSAPYYATFYYMWYKNPNTDGSWSYWTDHGNKPPNTWFSHYIPDPDTTAFDPSSELYSANNYENFRWQMQKMYEAKQEVAIASWWGQGTKEDQALKNILGDFMTRNDNPYPNLRWTIYYEDEAFGDPSLSTLISDLGHIKTTFASSPYFFKVNGKPVIFVYGGSDDSPGTMTQRWKDANSALNNEFYVVLKVFSGFKNDPNQPDSWHQYAPAVRTGTHAPYSVYVSPGFWLDDGSTPRLVRDPVSFENAVKGMVASNVTWKLVETWNEWGEGSSVEPGHQVRVNTTTGKEEIDPGATKFGNIYIDILNRNLPALEKGSGLNN